MLRPKQCRPRYPVSAADFRSGAVAAAAAPPRNASDSEPLKNNRGVLWLRWLRQSPRHGLEALHLGALSRSFFLHRSLLRCPMSTWNRNRPPAIGHEEVAALLWPCAENLAFPMPSLGIEGSGPTQAPLLLGHVTPESPRNACQCVRRFSDGLAKLPKPPCLAFQPRAPSGPCFGGRSPTVPSPANRMLRTLLQAEALPLHATAAESHYKYLRGPES